MRMVVQNCVLHIRFRTGQGRFRWYPQVVDEMRQSFSEAQRALIDDPCEALLIAAPAGAGKTRVLIGKAQQLIETGVPSDRLCILTFTQKSAQDIHARLTHDLGASSGKIVCHTFHGFALECLRKDSGRLGLGTDFSILPPNKAIQLLGRVVSEVSPDSELSEAMCPSFIAN